MADTIKPVAQWWIGMERLKTLFDCRWLTVAVVGMLMVLGLTHIPQEMVPKRLQVHMLDKLEHVLAYGLIAFLFLMSFRKPPGLKVMTIILLAGALLGAADEMTQPLVNRIASPIDFDSDEIGVTLACVLFLVMELRRRARTLRSVTQA